MKRLIFILLLSSTLANAQYYDALKQPPKEHPWRTVLAYSGSIALNAIGDGLNDSSHKSWGHAANAVSISLLLLEPCLNPDTEFKWYHRILTYFFIRFGVFDLTYNKTRGLPYNYMGTSSITDKFLQKLKPPEGFMMGRITFFAVGFSIPFNTGKIIDD